MKQTNIKIIIKEYLLNSSIHGLHFIADSKFHWTERIFWTVCVIASWVGSLILMINTIKEFQTQGMTFTVDTSYLHWTSNFPSIVICEKSNQKIHTSHEELPGPMFDVVKEIVFFRGRFVSKGFCKRGSSSRKYCIEGNFSLYSQRLRSTCSELFTSCYYNNKQFSCCDQFLPINTYHGICFAANSIVSGNGRTRDNLPFKIVRDVNIGLGNLSIEITNNEVELYALSSDSVPSPNNAKFILSKSDDSNTKVKPKRNLDIFLNIKEISTENDARKIDIKQRHCRFDNENNLLSSKTYSMSACENDCFIKAQKKLCDCVLHTLAQFEPEKECDIDGLVCTFDNIAAIQDYINECDCVSSCFEIEMNLIGDSFDKMEPIEFRSSKSVVRVNFIVYPPSVRYTRSVVKTSLDLIVSVGGTASLFVGASVLTIIEVIYYLIIRPCGDSYVKNQKRKQFQRNKLKRKNINPKLYVKDRPLLPYIN